MTDEEPQLRYVVERCRTVLANMAGENEGAGILAPRWLIHHEPLRADAKNLLPLIDAALAQSDAEPVKYEYRRHKGMGNWIECGKANYNANSEYEYRALYTTSPRPNASAEPMVTLDEIEAAMDRVLECHGFHARAAGKCEHQWVDARNEYVESGEVCSKCGAIRAADKSRK